MKSNSTSWHTANMIKLCDLEVHRDANIWVLTGTLKINFTVVPDIENDRYALCVDTSEWMKHGIERTKYKFFPLDILFEAIEQAEKCDEERKKKQGSGY